MAHVLIVDDEANLRRVLAAMLKRDGYEVTTAEDGEQALAAMQPGPIDVVVTDLACRAWTAWSCSATSRPAHPDVPVIMITAHGTVDTAVEAMKAGAFDYITKPFDQDELRKVIAKAVRAPAPSRRSTSTRPTGDGERPPLVGQSPPMRAVYAVIDQVADSPVHGAHHRRERHRQGAGRPGAPPRQLARGPSRSSR